MLTSAKSCIIWNMAIITRSLENPGLTNFTFLNFSKEDVPFYSFLKERGSLNSKLLHVSLTPEPDLNSVKKKNVKIRYITKKSNNLNFTHFWSIGIINPLSYQWGSLEIWIASFTPNISPDLHNEKEPPHTILLLYSSFWIYHSPRTQISGTLSLNCRRDHFHSLERARNASASSTCKDSLIKPGQKNDTKTDLTPSMKHLTYDN